MPIPGLLGKKLGMVQLIREDGSVVGCTVLEVGPCPVILDLQSILILVETC